MTPLRIPPMIERGQMERFPVHLITRKRVQMFKNVVPLNWIKKSERWVLVPSYTSRGIRRRLKALIKVKGNCFFTSGVAHQLIDFVYRAVVQLELRDKKLIFSRGSVRRNRRPVINAVDICELDWDVGLSLIIPRTLSYSREIKLLIDNEKHRLRLMEIIVLQGLLRIAFPEKGRKWHSAMAASVIALGWGMLEKDTPAEVYVDNR